MLMYTPTPEAIWPTIITLLILDIITVFLRFLSRRNRKQPLLGDDWLTVISLAFVMGLASIMFYGLATKTLGYRAVSPSVQTRSEVAAADHVIVTARRLEYAFLCVSIPTLGMIKVSFLLLYKRIFVVDKSWKTARTFFINAMITIISLWAGGFTLTFLSMCKGDWQVLFIDIEATLEKCVDTLELGYALAISDFITDALIIIIPLPFIWRLQLTLQKKLAVSGVFLLGLLASAASLVRMVYQIWIKEVGFDPSFDEELMLTTELFWFLIEVEAGLLASSLPVLRGLIMTKSVDSVVRSIRGVFTLGSESGSSSTLKGSQALGTSNSENKTAQLAPKRSTSEYSGRELNGSTMV